MLHGRMHCTPLGHALQHCCNISDVASVYVNKFSHQNADSSINYVFCIVSEFTDLNLVDLASFPF